MIIDTTTFFMLGLGGLLTLVGLPLWRRKIPPNSLYGVRFPSTMADPVVWYEVNAVSGLDLVVLGAAIVLLTIVLQALGLPSNVLALAVVALFFVGLVFSLVRSIWLARKLKHRR